MNTSTFKTAGVCIYRSYNKATNPRIQLGSYRLSLKPVGTGYPRRPSWSLGSLVSVVTWKTWLPLEIIENKYQYRINYQYKLNINRSAPQNLQVDLRFQVDPAGQNTGQHESAVKRDGDVTRSRPGTCGPGGPLRPGRPLVPSRPSWFPCEARGERTNQITPTTLTKVKPKQRGGPLVAVQLINSSPSISANGTKTQNRPQRWFFIILVLIFLISLILIINNMKRGYFGGHLCLRHTDQLNPLHA